MRVALALLVLVPSTRTTRTGGLVADLDGSNWADHLAAGGPTLVAFYAPWCDYCQQLWPELEKIREIIRIGRIDATEERELAAHYEVASYPTVKLFKTPDLWWNYEGEMTSFSLERFISKKLGPVSKLENWTAAREFINKMEAIVVAVGIDLVNLSRIIDDPRVHFAHSDEEDYVKDLFDYEINPPGIAVLSAFGERSWITEPSLVPSRLVPAVTVYDPKAFFQVSELPAALYFDENSDLVFSAAERFRDVVRHVVVPTKEARIRERFDVETGVVLISGDRYYKARPSTLEEVVDFYDDYFHRRLRPSLRSEPAYPNDADGPVLRLTGNSFADHVNSSVDLLVAFVAPWCSHSQALRPTWDRLAATLAPVDSVRVGVFDATKNEIDVDGVDVLAFPTVYFFGHHKAPEKYQNDKSHDALLAFVKDRASHAVDVCTPHS